MAKEIFSNPSSLVAIYKTSIENGIDRLLERLKTGQKDSTDLDNIDRVKLTVDKTGVDTFTCELAGGGKYIKSSNLNDDDYTTFLERGAMFVKTLEDENECKFDVPEYIRKMSKEDMVEQYRKLMVEHKKSLIFADGLSRFMEPDVIRAVKDGRIEDIERGNIEDLSVMFVDIRNSTKITYGWKPHKTIRLINEFASYCGDIARAYGGQVDKIMGDGIMIIFRPLTVVDKHVQKVKKEFRANHALRAVTAATQIMQHIKRQFKHWEMPDGEDAGTEIRAGVGIASGHGLVGLVQSSQQYDYTVIGDVANYASRIESQNKSLGSSILISEETYKAIIDRPFIFKEHPAQNIKGFEGKKVANLFEVVTL